MAAIGVYPEPGRMTAIGAELVELASRHGLQWAHNPTFLVPLKFRIFEPDGVRLPRRARSR